ncbi:MAG: hypothetical protein JWM21_677 [Acidobacteria bacterium]|nr:hypothetical protein [Acidobacteriota bacterium]
MSAFPGSPKLVKGGIVLIDPDVGTVRKVIPLQYNPETLTRSLQIRGAGEAGDRTEALRLTGPPVETLKIEVEFDATDQLELPDQNPTVAEVGISAQLAVLETIVYPDSAQLQAADALARAGTLEIVPAEAPLTLFVWSKSRVLPVRLTEFSITEEAFDPSLNPIRAKVSLGMRVLSINDLPSTHKGNSLFVAYHQQKENLARRQQSGALNTLGLTRIL